MNRISTRDDGLNTSAGERQKVALDGDADPQRANGTREQSGGQLKR